MAFREPSTTRSDAAPAPPSAALVQVARAEFDRYHRDAEAARAGLDDWRARLRATAYALYRYLEEDECRRHRLLVELRTAGERPAGLIGAEIETLADLIDEGRALPSAPPTLTRATAEALGGAIFQELYLAVAQKRPLPPEGELIPFLLYMAVLPYIGADAAAEEIRIPPPPITCAGDGEAGRSAGCAAR